MKLNMKIERSIIFFDIETTGVSVNDDRIIEIFGLKFNPDETSEELYFLINPGIDISEGATELHGYTNESLADKPKFKDVIKDILEFFDNSDLGGHNSNLFDVQLLATEFKRCGYVYDLSKIKTIDTRRIYLKNNPKRLINLYKEYTGKDLENAHAASADVKATVEIFNAQVDKYGIKDLNEADLIGKTDSDGNRYLDLDGKFIKTVDNKYFYTFGKHKGEEICIENVGFIGWMLGKDFSNNTKDVAKKLQDYVLKKVSK